jgi:aminoglycoside phosphotransferase (APT) family kinase protein
MKLTPSQLLNATVIQAVEHHRVIVIDGIVAKYGSGVHLQEALNMTFVRTHTTIPIPKVLSQYKDENDIAWILMEHIPGDVLQDVWPAMSGLERGAILAELQDMVQQMHTIERPPGQGIGGVDGGLAVDKRELGSTRGGPFEKEEAFNAWLLGQIPEGRAVGFMEMVKGAFQTGHKICFAHEDLGIHNIIVKEGKVVGVIDWETAGWCPEYWDYVKTVNFVGLWADEEEWSFVKGVYKKGYFAEVCLDKAFSPCLRNSF